MALLGKLLEARRRRRRSSVFDSVGRRAVRHLERRLKFLLTGPLHWLLRPKRIESKLNLSEISSILVFRYDALGDAILATPVWRSVKRQAPHIRIGVMGSERNKQLLLSDPDIDEVYVVSRTPTLAVLRELLRARKVKWDVALNLFFHDKTRAAIFSRIAAPNAVSATIIRENKEKYLQLYSVVGDRPPLHPGTPMVLQNLMVLESVVDIALSDRDRIPSLPASPEAERVFTSSLPALLGTRSRYVLINTDASQDYREWGLENCYQLSLELLREHSDTQVFWTCAPQRRERVTQFLRDQATDLELLSTPTFGHLMSAVKHASAVVSPDTSVIHVAAAFGVPVVGIYLEQTEFLPYSSRSQVLYPSDHRTASLVPVDEVYRALLRLLDQ